ncbi:MAG: hypothetical protein HQK76_06295 [Desulfobacterales bacterium]|nr:hypothetical protein [Desulfobacterales bacterium]
MMINDSQKIVILVDDDPAQYSNLELVALRYFGSTQGTDLCVAENTNKVLEELENYIKVSPTSKIYAVLDYNMNLNVQGEQKPIESLFYNENFKHYLVNGGIIILYSGYIAQIYQSIIIMDAPKKYNNLALLIAEKSTVHTDDVFRMLKGTPYDKIPKLKALAEQYNYNLGNIISSLRKTKR